MSDYERTLGELGSRVSGVRAALVFEASGIEVCSWGEADPDVNSAEFAELIGRLQEAESVSAQGYVSGLSIQGERGQWLLLPVGQGYALALLADEWVPSGKLRFYAQEWVLANQGDFE